MLSASHFFRDIIQQQVKPILSQRLLHLLAIERLECSCDFIFLRNKSIG